MADNTELVKTAEQLLAAAKEYRGDRAANVDLLKQANKLRYQIEGPSDTVFRQWENVSTLNSVRMHTPWPGLTAELCILTAALDVLRSAGILQKIPKEGTITASQLSEAAGVDEHVVGTKGTIYPSITMPLT